MISRFGVTLKITIYNAKAFRSLDLVNFCAQHNIVLSHSSNYYPQGNGLAESSNNHLIRIIKRVLGHNKKALGQ